MNTKRLPPALAALLHTAESAASSALFTLLVGIIQQLATGQISGPELLTIFASGFVGALGLIYKSIRTSPALPQAEKEAMQVGISEAKQLSNEALSHWQGWKPFLEWLHAYHAVSIATPQNTPVISSNAATPPTPQAPLRSPLESQREKALADMTTMVTPAAFASLNVATNQMPSGGIPLLSSGAPVTFTIPQRSFADSALIPIVGPQNLSQK